MNQVDRIIVVDDDPDLRYLLCEVFASFGVSDCRAYRSLEDIEQDSAHVLAGELALVDVNLGAGPSGIDVCQWLRERRFGGKIVFLTGHAKSHPLVAEAVRQPGTDVLEKPVGVNALMKLVQRA